MELLAKLGVDWKLLIAQIVNFTILLAVLGVFVYKPLLNLLDDRRERIRKAMEDAEKIEKQKKEMDDLRLEQLKKIDMEVGALLERGKHHAERMRDEILDQAKREAGQILEKGRQQLENERSRVFQEVQGSVARIIVGMTEKILEREFSQSDQKRLLSALEKDIPTFMQ